MVNHPLQDSLPDGRRQAILDSPIDRTAQLSFIESTLAADLTSAPTFGAVEGGDGDVIGNAQDLVVIGDSILVLDDRFNHVKVYYGDQFRGTIAKPGRGPGELSAPVAMAFSQGELIVVDQFRRINVYDVGKPSAPLKRSFEIDIIPFDLCVLQEDLYILGYSQAMPELVHRFTLSGALAKSMFVLYKTSNDIVRFTLSTSRMICDAERRQLLIIPQDLGEIYALRTDGSVRWATRFEHYLGPSIHEMPSGGVRVGFADTGDTTYAVRTTSRLPSGPLLVQLEAFVRPGSPYRLSGKRPPVPVAVMSYVVDPNTGAGELWTTRLPRILYGDHRKLVTVVDTPAPRIRIHSINADYPANAHEWRMR